MRNKNWWRVMRPWLVVTAATLALTIGLGNRVQPATAQQAEAPKNARVADQAPAPEAPLGPSTCMQTQCGVSSPCTAEDVRIASLTTVGAEEPCTYTGDTGTYYFRAQFVSGANTRYDPGVWVATDGGNAKTGQCYRDYLIAPLTTTYTPPWGPPYWDAEDGPGSGDECGDISQKTTVYRDIGPVTIQCNAANLDGSINTCIGWDQNSGANCPANNNCPGNGAKCRCEQIAFEVNINRVDLKLVKTASVSPIPPNGEFEYQFSVSNVQSLTPCYKSTGYTITDNLPIWLKVRSLPADCTSTPDPTEACYTYEGGCQGFGDVVKCIVPADLTCPDTAPDLTLPVALWIGDPPVPPEDPRAQPPPDTIPNTACVAGFEDDPVSGNNCGSAEVPAAVELEWFKAAGRIGLVKLGWETASEIDNLGFNLYRATLLNGPKTKVNQTLIPSSVPPGSPFGAVYIYRDTTVQPGVRYFYWLENVDVYGHTGLHGPVKARAY